VPRQYLTEILQPRTVELFKLVKEEITGRGFHSILSSGAVLTGGSALMDGIDVMAENILDLPVRKGFPRVTGGMPDVIATPEYSAGIGLVLYGARETLAEHRTNNGKGPKKFISRVKTWATETFG
jgi:cell division protein FtsA